MGSLTFGNNELKCILHGVGNERGKFGSTKGQASIV